MTPSGHARPEAAVVDLVAIAQACEPVVECYDRMRAMAERHQPLDEQTKACLPAALGRLRRLPRCGGRLGRAIALIASGGIDFSVGETLAALEVLRTTLGRGGRPRRAPTPPPWPTPVPEDPVQLSLAGLELDADRRGDDVDGPRQGD